MTAFESDRRFEVWRWGVGHRGLLLRTVPTSGDGRQEVWIKPAYAALLPTTLDGVVIEQASADQIAAWSGQGHGLSAAAGQTLYAVRSGGFSGWVLGGSLNLREDDGQAPSPWDDVLPPD